MMCKVPTVVAEGGGGRSVCAGRTKGGSSFVRGLYTGSSTRIGAANVRRRGPVRRPPYAGTLAQRRGGAAHLRSAPGRCVAFTVAGDSWQLGSETGAWHSRRTHLKSGCQTTLRAAPSHRACAAAGQSVVDAELEAMLL